MVLKQNNVKPLKDEKWIKTKQQQNKISNSTPHHQDSWSGSSLILEHFFFPHKKGQVEKGSLGGRKSMKMTFKPSYYTQ